MPRRTNSEPIPIPGAEAASPSVPKCPPNTPSSVQYPESSHGSSRSSSPYQDGARASQASSSDFPLPPMVGSFENGASETSVNRLPDSASSHDPVQDIHSLQVPDLNTRPDSSRTGSSLNSSTHLSTDGIPTGNPCTVSDTHRAVRSLARRGGITGRERPMPAPRVLQLELYGIENSHQTSSNEAAGASNYLDLTPVQWLALFYPPVTTSASAPPSVPASSSSDVSQEEADESDGEGFAPRSWRPFAVQTNSDTSDRSDTYDIPAEAERGSEEPPSPRSEREPNTEIEP